MNERKSLTPGLDANLKQQVKNPNFGKSRTSKASRLKGEHIELRRHGPSRRGREHMQVKEDKSKASGSILGARFCS